MQKRQPLWTREGHKFSDLSKFMYMDLAKVPFQWNIRFVFRDLSSWKAEPFLHETGRFCEIWWNLFKIPKSVWQSPASVLWPDFPVYIASVRGPDLIMWSETVLVKLLNHHFFFFFFGLLAVAHFLGLFFSSVTQFTPKHLTNDSVSHSFTP